MEAQFDQDFTEPLDMSGRVFMKAIKIVSIILIAASVLFSASFSHALSPEDDSENRLEEIERRLQETQQKLQSTREKENQYLTEIKNLEAELDTTQNSLNALETELDVTRNSLQEIEKQLQIAQKELESLRTQLSRLRGHVEKTEQQLEEKRRELTDLGIELAHKVNILNERAAAIYKNGEITYLNILVGSTDLRDLATRWLLLSRLAERDATIVKEVKDLKKKVSLQKELIEDKKRLLLEKQRQIEEVAAAAQSKRNEIKAKYEQKVALQNQIKSQYNRKKNLKNTILASYDQKSNLLAQAEQDEKALEALEKELKKESEAIRARLSERTEGERPAGRLTWPAQGTLTSGFGPRGGRIHEGIDIAGSYGFPIIAAEDGEIVQVNEGYGGGYGKYVVIYHGGGLSTLYAHNSRNAVSVGEKVKRGQVIAYMGSTGNSSGDHLHFEVRIEGVPIDPLGYL